MQSDPINLCHPSPCGRHSECTVRHNNAHCECLPNYIGAPPNCRPECITNDDCSNYLACINLHCKNPCTNSCGLNAQCSVTIHTANCYCPENMNGNPFVECLTTQSEFLMLKYYYCFVFFFFQCFVNLIVQKSHNKITRIVSKILDFVNIICKHVQSNK